MTGTAITRRWQQTPVPVQWAAVCGVLLTVIAALVFALVAVVRSNDVGACVNNNLSQRNSPNIADRVAIDQLFAAQQSTIKAAFTGHDKAKQRAAFERLLASYGTYQHTRESDDAARAKHPIGRC